MAVGDSRISCQVRGGEGVCCVPKAEKPAASLRQDGGLELPQALGLGVAVADFAEAEPAEVCQDDQEAH
jgi:hypothetical protein